MVNFPFWPAIGIVNYVIWMEENPYFVEQTLYHIVSYQKKKKIENYTERKDKIKKHRNTRVRPYDSDDT